jgi:ribosome biogenesis GTPase
VIPSFRLRTLLRPPVPKKDSIPALNTVQKQALQDRLGQMTVKQRKDTLRQAGELRQAAQKNSKKPVGSIDDFVYRLVCTDPVGEVGTVVRAEATLCHVQIEKEVKPMTMPRELRPVVGDEVEVDLAKNRISRILPRKTSLARPLDGMPDRERPVAANIDLVAVVVSVGTPPLHPRLIDRYLFAIHKGGAKPLIVVNKLDLLAEMDAVKQLDRLEPYRAMGIACVNVSATLGRGLELLRREIAGKRVVFVGHSGVGKSSLLIALVRAPLPVDEWLGIESDAASQTPLSPAGSLQVEGALSEKSGRGRHTTTSSQLYALEDGTEIVDTPGVRSFAVDIEQDVLEGFPDLAKFVPDCNYGDCQHLEEEGCAVKAAVRDGRLPKTRYETYRRLMDGEVATGMGFVCVKCGATAASTGAGTQHRNHCPRCLHSVHLDYKPGDRLALCGGTMEPVSVWVRKMGEWGLIHRCRECGAFSSNRIAADDNEMLLLSIAAKPMSQPPFPLELMEAGS